MNLKGDDDEKLVKVANVRKDNYNINIMENFPMDIEIGPKVWKFSETFEAIGSCCQTAVQFLGDLSKLE